MDIVAFIACWKREEITRLCFENVKSLGLEAFCVVSEKTMIDLCKEFEFKYVITENYPIGEKFNQGISGMLETDFDYCLQMNSDTVIDERLLTEVYKFDRDYFGVDQCHFLDSETGEVLRMKYDTVIGAGRVMSRKAIEDTISKRGKIWRPDINKGLDNHSDFSFTISGYQAYIYDLENRPYLWDIKSQENIWPFDFFRDRAEKVNVKLPTCLKKFAPEISIA
jgi:hypothetical protein